MFYGLTDSLKICWHVFDESKVKSKVSYKTYSRVSNWVEILHEDCNIVYEGSKKDLLWIVRIDRMYCKRCKSNANLITTLKKLPLY